MLAPGTSASPNPPGAVPATARPVVRDEKNARDSRAVTSERRSESKPEG